MNFKYQQMRVAVSSTLRRNFYEISAERSTTAPFQQKYVFLLGGVIPKQYKKTSLDVSDYVEDITTSICIDISCEFAKVILM